MESHLSLIGLVALVRRTASKHLLWWASHSRIPAFRKPCENIKQHTEHTLNTIQRGMSNTCVEATNNKINLTIRKAYNYLNIENMLDMVDQDYSDLRIALLCRKRKAIKSELDKQLFKFLTNDHKLRQ